ncbi:MAG: protein-L-isoaspartate O-methyltransferase, partial [Gemmatimonadetes bacterium]|nr:protein-L-isoaspartate O-methyltransferase [Gemmatimonadota bacterium]
MEPRSVSERYAEQRGELIDQIRASGIDDLEILSLFDRVPRHLFVADAVRARAYENSALPIGFGQTTSQPSLQARYLQVLRLMPDDHVLEIGTGSGYFTALLAQLA